MIEKSTSNLINKTSKKDIIHLSDTKIANTSGGGVWKYFSAPYKKAFYAITGNDKHITHFFVDDDQAYNAGILASVVTQVGVSLVVGSVGTMVISKVHNSIKNRK